MVECSRAAFAAGESPTIGEVPAAIDWGRFVRNARFHRVQGLVWHSLCSARAQMPPEHAAALSADVEAIVTANLNQPGTFSAGAVPPSSANG